MESMNTFRVILKDGKPWLRMTRGDTVTDCMIYHARTDAPYIKYGGLYLGKTYLEPAMIAELRTLIH